MAFSAWPASTGRCCSLGCRDSCCWCSALAGGKWVDIYARLKILAVGYAMLSILLTIIGMLLISTALICTQFEAYSLDLLSHPKLGLIKSHCFMDFPRHSAWSSITAKYKHPHP